jgi:hypothetical protein
MDLKKSLEEINNSVIQGNLDDNYLVLANQLFKSKTNFKNNSEYQLVKSLSLNDFLKNGSSNQELMKALVLGETKVGSDGKTYIAVKTPSGKIDWRVLKTKTSGVDLLDDVFDNDDFPVSANDFIFSNKNIGGSTGAKLVTDKNTGTEYVLKEGASEGHVREEFLTNAIYKTMGFDTPEMKFYEGVNGAKPYLLSKFIPNSVPFDKLLGKGDALAMDSAKDGFVLDCLLGNWDVYQNDNILVDSNGIPIRVDNGGSLRYRAQGGLKTNFSNSVDELNTMIKSNQWLGPLVTQDVINTQIEDILKNEKSILDLIEDKNLKSLVKARIIYLKNRLPAKSAFKTLKKGMGKGMYRELTEDELQTCYDSVNGDLHLIDYKGGEGWKFLSEICKLRGFNEIPEILENKDFDKLLYDKGNIFVNRGMRSGGGMSAKNCMNSFSEGDVCFYGTIGVHGAGIYTAINEKRINNRKDDGYQTALSYAGGKPENILDLIIPKNAKIITKKQIKVMMQDEFFGPEFKSKKDEFDNAEKQYLKGISNLDVEKDKIEDRTKKQLGWNQDTLDFLIFERPEVKWADTKKNSVDSVIKNVENLISEISGTVNQLDSVNYEIKLPNSSSKFTFNTHDFDDALKTKNINSDTYNFTISRLKEFMIQNHFEKIKGKVDGKIKEAIKSDKVLMQMNKDILKSKNDLDKIELEVNLLRKNGVTPSNKIIGHILKQKSSEMYGIYAAIKGYDALLVEGGNGGADFAVVLNRNITKVRKFN